MMDYLNSVTDPEQDYDLEKTQSGSRGPKNHNLDPQH